MGAVAHPWARKMIAESGAKANDLDLLSFIGEGVMSRSPFVCHVFRNGVSDCRGGCSAPRVWRVLIRSLSRGFICGIAKNCGFSYKYGPIGFGVYEPRACRYRS